MFCSKTNLTQCNFPVTKMKLNFQKLKSETTETFICKCSPEQIFENQESSKGYIYNGAPFLLNLTVGTETPTAAVL